MTNDQRVDPPKSPPYRTSVRFEGDTENLFGREFQLRWPSSYFTAPTTAKPPRLPSKYDGEDTRLKTLKMWSDKVACWFRDWGLDPDCIRSFYYIAGFLDGRAERYFFNFIVPEMDMHRATYPNAAMTDASPLPLSVITDKLQRRFVPKFAGLEAERRFEQVTQHRGRKYIPVQDMADELEDLSTDLIECSQYRLKKQFLDSLDPEIGIEVNCILAYDRDDVKFRDLVDTAIRCERTMLAFKAKRRAERSGRTLSNMEALAGTSEPMMGQTGTAQSKEDDLPRKADAFAETNLRPRRRHRHRANREPPRAED
jgi:hypothetical protein